MLNLYDQGGQFGAADVTVVGETSGAVRGSLVVAADARSVTFIRTGAAMPADVYTVTLQAASTSFRDAAGFVLDGDGNGLSGGDYTTSFTVAAPAGNAVVVSLPDFARGFGQAVNLPATGVGLPLSISTGRNVSSIEFALRFDPTLLNVTDFNLSLGLPTNTKVTTNAVSAGNFRVLIYNDTGELSGEDGPLVLGSFTASVPMAAPYAAKQVLYIDDLAVFDNSGSFGSARPSVADAAVHVAAFLGDASGDGLIQSNDAVLARWIVTQVNTGFTAMQTADPTIIVDASGDGAIRGDDARAIARKAIAFAIPELPFTTAGAPVVRGVDPILRLDAASADVDGVVLIPVTVSVPAGEPPLQVSSFQFAISYDPTLLSFTDASFGDATSSFTVTANTALGAGVLAVNGVSETPTTQITDASGSITIAMLRFHALGSGVTVVNLLANLENSENTVHTGVFDGGANPTTLSPVPTNAATDAVDALVTITNRAPTSVTLANVTSTLFENTSTANRIKLADIVVADDTFGTNNVTLSGTDAAQFEVVGTGLYL
jgi:hypothetical protein